MRAYHAVRGGERGRAPAPPLIEALAASDVRRVPVLGTTPRPLEAGRDLEVLDLQVDSAGQRAFLDLAHPDLGLAARVELARPNMADGRRVRSVRWRSPFASMPHRLVLL